MDIGVFLDKQTKKMGTGYIHILILQSSNGKIASSKIAVKWAYIIARLLVWGVKYHDFANFILLFACGYVICLYSFVLCIFRF